MATSSKVQFSLETLKQKALESMDARIKSAERVVASFEDDAALSERIKEWRAEQETRVSDLFRSLDEIADHTLAKWKIQPLPETSTYERDRAVSDLRRLRDLRTKIVAKAESLVPDDAGNISLTKTQLQEFFGL